jgi:hypothetical protein
MDEAGEARLDQVVQQLAADRPTAARRADHRHRVRLQYRPHGRHPRDPLPVAEARLHLGGQRGRKLDMQLAPPRPHLDGEPALPKDVDHPVVTGEHLSGERRDGGRLGRGCQLPQQDRGQATALEGVCDREGQLGPARLVRDVFRVAHDGVVRAADGDQPVGGGSVGRRGGAGVRLEVGAHREEPQGPRVLGQAGEEPQHRRLVVAADGSHAHRRAVAQRDVDDSIARAACWDGRPGQIFAHHRFTAGRFTAGMEIVVEETTAATERPAPGAEPG